jgi:hypothetical protein
MKLTVLLGASGEASFDINLNENSFTQKWVKELDWALNHVDFNQDETFAYLDSIEESSMKLRQSCLTINSYLNNFIEVCDNVSNQPQEYFNYLHMIFEKLSGGFNTPTRLWTVANRELKDAIRALNFYVHLLEPKKTVEQFYISFDKNQYRRHRFDELDYENFVFEFPKGTLYLHYAELGKELLDLYEDNLPINYENFKNSHFYSAEASLAFEDWNTFEDQNYLMWLQKHNINPYNKALGHGKIPLGYVDDIDSVFNKVKEYRHVFKIIIKE